MEHKFIDVLHYYIISQMNRQQVKITQIDQKHKLVIFWTFYFEKSKIFIYYVTQKDTSSDESYFISLIQFILSHVDHNNGKITWNSFWISPHLQYSPNMGKKFISNEKVISKTETWIVLQKNNENVIEAF